MKNSRWKIYLAVENHDLIVELMNIFKYDNRFFLNEMVYKSNVIYECLKIKPDILIIEEGIFSLPMDIIITGMKSMDLLNDLKILGVYKELETGIDESNDVDRILQLGKENKYTISDKIVSLLNTPEVIKNAYESFINKRKWNRFDVNIPVQFELIEIKDKGNDISGIAFLKNISREGALLENMNPDLSLLKITHSKIRLNAKSSFLADWHSKAEIVRFGSHSCGIMFIDVSEDDLKKITALNPQ